MTKHISFRVAWHDNKWNGTICKDPKSNIYCRGNYSLLSPRIQRRIKLDLEQEYSTRKLKLNDFIDQCQYLPPCYWGINIFGDAECKISDSHPFSDLPRYESMFNSVPPLQDTLTKYSGYTWDFQLGFSDVEGEQYVPEAILNSRLNDYIDGIKSGKSIAFYYVNYSNPVSGNDFKYVIVGASLIKDAMRLNDYEIPPNILESIRARQPMRNFPSAPWQFKLCADPESALLMPYHDYLEHIEHASANNRDEKWKQLNEIAITVDEPSIIQNFKYVSRQITNDKTIFLLYSMKKKIEAMKNHSVVDSKKITEIEQKVDVLLKIAWEVRGRFPGFRNIANYFLRNQFGKESQLVVEDVIKTIDRDYGGLGSFFEKRPDTAHVKDNKLRQAFQMISDNFDKISFLAQFDFSRRQFINILELLKTINFARIKDNPYIILEKYCYEPNEKEVDIDDADFGLALYNFDIALIPDFKYVDWSTNYNAESIERLRAVIMQILVDTATGDGSSCLSRNDILEKVEEYPLYYINERFKINVEKLVECEGMPCFKEVFYIYSEIGKDDVFYQLDSIRKLEHSIESFIDGFVDTSYVISNDERIEIQEIVNNEEKIFHDRVISNERRRLYSGVLSNKLFVISGKAGSGKTSAIVNLISKFMREGKYPIKVFTPTGKASLVIKKRLNESGLKLSSKLQVSTIHRFLYSALFETDAKSVYGDAIALNKKIDRILKGRYELLKDYEKDVARYKFCPQVVIIDESSMVDECILALLFNMLSASRIKHLILVGDERQLPPIGLGKPFVDIIHSLKKRGFENKIIRLESSLRFDSESSLGLLSEKFGQTEPPSPPEIDDALKRKDANFELKYFNEDNMERVIKEILQNIRPMNDDSTLFEMFSNIFEEDGEIDIDKVQIITPRRVGKFGSEGINLHLIMDGNFEIKCGTKLICEENMYCDLAYPSKKKHVLGLANGSIGCIDSNSNIRFRDIDDLEQDFGTDAIAPLINDIKSQLGTSMKIERKINIGYAITIHKSQGSDFNYVILVIPETSSFITKELLYTAITRAKTKLILLVNKSLSDELGHILSKACESSVLEQRNTLLFGFKRSLFKPYAYRKKNGEEIEVRSKIELLIAKALDENDIEYDYEPNDFHQEYRIRPDFKLSVNGKEYYIEHLGDMAHKSYQDRWYRKWKIYSEILKIGDLIITTEESKGRIDEGIRAIINDIKSGNLAKCKSPYSQHHYEL